MIKNFIILILLLCIFVVLKKLNKEHFHEVSEMVNDENENEQCEEEDTYENDSSIGCSKYKDFNPYPEKKPFILSRCLVNHTTSNNNFKDDIVSGCPRHETLCESSGCKAAVNYYWKNLETLKSITDITFANRQDVDGQGSSRFSRRGQYSNNYSNNYSDNYSDNYDGLLSNCSCNYEIDKTSNENNLYEEWLSKISE